MKLVLYFSNSVWLMMRETHKKLIFVGGRLRLTHVIKCPVERQGKGECGNFEGNEICLGYFPWIGDKNKVKIPNWGTNSSNKTVKLEILTPFHMSSLSVKLRCCDTWSNCMWLWVTLILCPGCFQNSGKFHTLSLTAYCSDVPFVMTLHICAVSCTTLSGEYPPSTRHWDKILSKEKS